MRVRIKSRNSHGHDLILQPHFHAEERVLPGGGFLEFQICASGNTANMFDRYVDAAAAAGDGAVDAFGRQQQGARDTGLAADFQQRLPAGGEIGHRGEFVQCRHHEPGGGSIFGTV
jgi:hypothetical protein